MPMCRKLSRKLFAKLDAHYAKAAGYTMVELMVVVAVVGAVAAVAIPSFTRVDAQMADSAAYAATRMGIQRCRAEALNAALPMTSPTALAIFPNGFACIGWNDFASGAPDNRLGDGDVDPGANGILDAGEADGEITTVFFQERYDREQSIMEAGAGPSLDIAGSVLQVGVANQNASTGFLLPIRPGGYFVSNTGGTFVATLRLVSPSGNNAYYTILPSGQIVGK